MIIKNFQKRQKKVDLFRTSKLSLGLVALAFTGSLMAQTPELVSDDPLDPTELTEHSGQLYFNAEADDGYKWLWRTDGANTELLTPDWIPSGSQGDQPRELKTYNDKLIMSAKIKEPGAFYHELCEFDEEQGVTNIRNIYDGGASDPKNFIELNDKLYFSAEDGNKGRELWRTDGTEMGTILVKDIEYGYNSSHPYNFTKFDNKIFFTATNGITNSGTELWVTDGSESGTQMLKDINPGASPSFPGGFTEFKGKLYFYANDGTNGNELWVTDGTESGTEIFKDINEGSGESAPKYFTEFDDKLYFVADDGNNGKELWVTDGTVSGTVMLKDINQGSESGSPHKFTVFNDKLYFIADDGTQGRELWVTDGTTSGTELFKDINSGSGDAFPTTNSPELSYYFTEYNGRLYFPADGGTNGIQLWESDGTPEGTVVVEPDVAGNSNPLEAWPNPNIVYDNSFYFVADFDGNGRKLWKLTTQNLSVEEHIEGEFTLYPNPVEDMLYIEAKVDNIQSVELFSISGQRLKTWNGQSEIDMFSFSQGNYFVKINAGKGRTVTKQIIKK